MSSGGDIKPRSRREIAAAFLLLGVTFGGPAIMAVMQTELQERRQWLSKARLVEGLSLVAGLPGATATQLGIYIGYVTGGWWGGLIAGLCFVLPAFFVMLALAAGYAAYGALPFIQGALYGLSPVVLAVFLAAMYRLGRNVASTPLQIAVAVAAAAVCGLTSVGVAVVLAFAGTIGIALFHSRKIGAAAFLGVGAVATLLHFAPWSFAVSDTAGAGLGDIASFFLMAGAFSFGGGLSLVAFIQEHVVHHYRWLTTEEFLAGLALGQFTPGPIIMVAAYVGYKLAGVLGAAVAFTAVFLPSFVLMLSLLPVFEKVRRLEWTKAAMKAIGPAVVGVLGLSLLRMSPHALPDATAVAIFLAAVTALFALQIGIFKLMAGGALFGALRTLVSR